MKKFLLFLFTTVALGAAAQNTDYIVSMAGIGPIKIGAQKDALEKLLGKKITLKYLLDKEGYADTIKAKIKNMDVILYLGKKYVDENKEDIILTGIRSSSPLCKTKNGIGIGDDKIKIINLYENNMLNIYPDYEDDTYSKRSKSRSVINVYDEESENALVFYLVNKKVVAFEVTYYEGE